MDFDRFSEVLADDRCGLFFLAGVDKGGPVRGAVLTVHAAQGTLRPENIRFMRSALTTTEPRVKLRTRLHSPSELHAPDSLEAFARLFRHDHVVSDPTGAFARVSKLLALSRHIRNELRGHIARLLWQADSSSLVVVLAAVPTNRIPTARQEGSAVVQQRLESLVANRSCPDLRRAIRSLQVAIDAPSSRYTPVDAASVDTVERRPLTRAFVRISGIAGLIGLGVMSVAHSRVPDAVDKTPLALPGVTGLIGLTTLGENSYGLRNRFQAAGGLRLYFGPSDVLMASVIAPAVPCVADCAKDKIDEQEEATPPQSLPVWPKPSRVQYGT